MALFKRVSRNVILNVNNIMRKQGNVISEMEWATFKSLF